MSLHSSPIPPIPPETMRVAQAAFPRGNVLMRIRDTLGAIYQDEQFVDLFPARGQPAEAPWRLALVTVLQVLEHLSDCQAADAERSAMAAVSVRSASLPYAWGNPNTAITASPMNFSSVPP
jgi:transposase